MKNHSAEHICELLIDRVVTGTYPEGSKLPAARDLAREVGAHRNTVVKAYNLLSELGLATVKRGSGTYVTSNTTSERAVFETSLKSQLNKLVTRAQRAGISRDSLQRTVGQEIERVYASPQRSGVFIECNESDLAAIVSEVALFTDVHLQPILLGAVKSDPAKTVGSADVVFTSFFHLDEIKEILASASLEVTLLGLHTEADERALEQIAQIPSGSNVGVVVSNSDGARRFIAQINTVANVTTRAAVMPTGAEIQELCSWAETLVCSRSQLARIQSLNVGISTIELPFHVSQSSASRVKQTLLLAGQEDTAARIDGHSRSGMKEVL